MAQKKDGKDKSKEKTKIEKTGQQQKRGIQKRGTPIPQIISGYKNDTIFEIEASDC